MGGERPIRPGLLSVTFRKLAVEQVVDLAVEAGLSAIEWGGDVHVPHGDLATARAVRRMCADGGLAVSAYGSYYRADGASGGGPTIGAVLDTAAALGATTVRVWAGGKGSAEATDADRAAVVDDLNRCCDLGAARGITVATEFHGGTLTDDVDSTTRLLAAVPAVATFWQPPVGMEPAAAVDGLRRVRRRVSNVHVFHWWPDGAHRLPLAAGGDRWPAYLREVAEQSAVDGRVRFASLEFVANDDRDQFRQDAATLREWLSAL